MMKKGMKISQAMNTVLFCLFIFAPMLLIAQEEPGQLSREGTITLQPVYEHWSIGSDSISLSQFSTAVDVHLPIGRSLNFHIKTAPLAVTGDPEEVRGMNDTQLGLSYLLDKAHLVFNLGLNLPTGQRELTVDEFLTGLMISNRVFAFQSPHLGQGLKVHPSVLWAIPLSRNVVAGLGAAYQYRAAFTPIAAFEDYDPGDEIQVLAGLDFRLAENSVLSMDVLYTHFSADKLGSREIFNFGERLNLNARFSTSFGHDVLWLYGSYRFKSDSDVWPGRADPYGGESYLIAQNEIQDPDNLELFAYYGWMMNDAFSLGMRLEGRYFGPTDAALSDVMLYGAALLPEFSFGDISIPLRFGIRSGEAKDGLALFSYYGGLGLRYNIY
jgi:hypothetical protein